MLPQKQQQQQSLKRQLRFSSIKPVFGDYHRFSTDRVHDSSQEPPGIVVKTPNEADYWLLSDADVSITDMWRTESAIDWNELDVIQEDYSIANVSTPRTQTPPPATTEVPSADNTTGC